MQTFILLVHCDSNERESASSCYFLRGAIAADHFSGHSTLGAVASSECSRKSSASPRGRALRAAHSVASLILNPYLLAAVARARSRFLLPTVPVHLETLHTLMCNSLQLYLLLQESQIQTTFFSYLNWVDVELKLGEFLFDDSMMSTFRKLR